MEQTPEIPRKQTETPREQTEAPRKQASLAECLAMRKKQRSETPAPSMQASNIIREAENRAKGIIQAAQREAEEIVKRAKEGSK